MNEHQPPRWNATGTYEYDRAIATVEGSIVANHLLRELMDAMGKPLTARPDTPESVWTECLDEIRRDVAPCGTCGGMGFIPTGGDFDEPLHESCPDCGVETPEAAGWSNKHIAAVLADHARLSDALELIVTRHPDAVRGEHPAVDIARDALAGWTPPGGTE